MMASSRGRDRSSPWDGRGFGRIGCLLHQAEEHAIMNRAETEDGSYASGRNRKLLAEWAAKAGENEYAEPALNPCQTTAYTFFTGDALVPYAARRRRGEPISTAFVESAVNEIVAKRMNKAQQMRWNRATVQPFLDVRTAVLNDTLEDAFRQRYPGFRPGTDDNTTAAAA